MAKWFECWFDSAYYHVLYKHRDDKEAAQFIRNLLQFLKPSQGSRILDVACGKGRHALQLHDFGYDVTGFDLAEQNIAYTKQFEQEGLRFFVHDMRATLCVNYFDYVLSLFSSFGYFDFHHDNEKTMRANRSALKPGGILVIDYMNSILTRKNLIRESEDTVDGIVFRQTRSIKANKVIKKIMFEDGGRKHQYEEHLQLYTLQDFEKMFHDCGFKLVTTFGDYQLNPYSEADSKRLILVAEKIIQE